MGCDGFFELEAQVNGLLLEVSDLLAESADAGQRAEPGFVPGILAGDAWAPGTRSAGHQHLSPPWDGGAIALRAQLSR
jgi:hypothetical protein